jgi:hypothetical protein
MSALNQLTLKALFCGGYANKPPQNNALAYEVNTSPVLQRKSPCSKEARQLITRMVVQMSAPTLNDAQVKLAVDREIRLAQIRGEKMQGQVSMDWMIWNDPQGKAKPVLRTPLMFNDIRYESFKKAINTEVRAGVCVALVQAWCLTKTIADYGKALEGDKSEAGWRLMAGSLAVSGTLIESLGVVAKNAHITG